MADDGRPIPITDRDGLPARELVTLDYTNHRGERSLRTVKPLGVFFGQDTLHPEPQYLLVGWDLEKRAMRHFAMRDIHKWEKAPQ
jgi:predicted DNA-binding transcriptional regulator YafY